ncbi:MAG: response regulator transcription factor [Elusimicrobia bacterium]|nr:response regulator transcription factor [Elusimicrobiota bacterium]
MKSKILVVEDDRAIASFIKNVLKDHDFAADHVTDADKALEYLKSYQPDLIVLDINLPGLSGMQFCGIIRKDPKNSGVPILMLTVLGGENERVKGLMAGADDYLAKPFNPKELIARIQAILRRAGLHPDIAHILSVHGIKVDLDRHEVWVLDQKVELRPKEFDLLVTFLERPGRVLTPQFLAEKIWGLDAIVTKHTLNEHLKNLRQKLGKLGDLIETLTNTGYRLKEVESKSSG